MKILTNSTDENGGKKRGSRPNPRSINTSLVKKELSEVKVLAENVPEGYQFYAPGGAHRQGNHRKDGSVAHCRWTSDSSCL